MGDYSAVWNVLYRLNTGKRMPRVYLVRACPQYASIWADVADRGRIENIATAFGDVVKNRVSNTLYITALLASVVGHSRTVQA
jgi:hypothetical protein